jgi:beta-lactamase class A
MAPFSLLLIAALVQAQPSPPVTARGLPAGLQADVTATIAQSGAEVAVAFRTLDGRMELLVDPDKTFHAASTMKVPIMIELFRQAAAGTLSLDEPLSVRNEFKSIVDGTVYSLSVGDDSDAKVYAAVGRTLTLRELCEAMITVSSNFAANLLIERLGVDNVRATVSRLGADGMQVLRGVEDTKAFQQGKNNTTTARGLLILMEKLAKGEAVGRSADNEMIEVLKRQQFRDAIPTGLPVGTPVAHKTGSITRIHHDAAIVFGPRPFVLVILTRGIEDPKQSAALMAALSRTIFQAVR